MEAKGSNNCKDIHIQNFILHSYCLRRQVRNNLSPILRLIYGFICFFFVDSLCVLKGFDSSLAHGRKYGFIGRDGLGKTTLLHDFIVKKKY
jgi:hypothetical protein